MQPLGIAIAMIPYDEAFKVADIKLINTMVMSW